MGLYTRRQLGLLLALLAAVGIGLGVRHWRAAHPDVAARLESFDLASPDERGDRDGQVDRHAAPPRSRRSKSTVVVTGDDPLDLNRATADDLLRLPGVGPALAARILALRTASGFSSVDDLGRVKGLGRGRIERLRPFVSVAPPSAAPGAGTRAPDARAVPAAEAPSGSE